MAEVEIATGAAAPALADWLARHPKGARAVLAEGLFERIELPGEIPLLRLAPGCVCCVGQLPLRVSLVRLLRQHRPQHLLLLLANGSHLERVVEMLGEPGLGLQRITAPARGTP